MKMSKKLFTAAAVATLAVAALAIVWTWTGDARWGDTAATIAALAVVAAVAGAVVM